MGNLFRDMVLRNSSLLIVALQNVFIRHELSFACLFYTSRSGCESRIVQVAKSAISEDVEDKCRRLAEEASHPALSEPARFLSPFDLLAASETFADNAILADLIGLARAQGFKTLACIPLRDVCGDRFISLVTSRARAASEQDLKIVHSECYGALAMLEAELAQASDKASVLSERERQCLICAARGLTERETAVELGISQHTVHAHIESTKRRLQAPNKLVSVIKSIKNGYISQDDIVFD